jgi:hypothetical protein
MRGEIDHKGDCEQHNRNPERPVGLIEAGRWTGTEGDSYRSRPLDRHRGRSRFRRGCERSCQTTSGPIRRHRCIAPRARSPRSPLVAGCPPFSGGFAYGNRTKRHGHGSPRLRNQPRRAATARGLGIPIPGLNCTNRRPRLNKGLDSSGREGRNHCVQAMELGGLEPPTSWVRSRRSPN